MNQRAQDLQLARLGGDVCRRINSHRWSFLTTCQLDDDQHRRPLTFSKMKDEVGEPLVESCDADYP